MVTAHAASAPLVVGPVDATSAAVAEAPVGGEAISLDFSLADALQSSGKGHTSFYEATAVSLASSGAFSQSALAHFSATTQHALAKIADAASYLFSGETAPVHESAAEAMHATIAGGEATAVGADGGLAVAGGHASFETSGGEGLALTLSIAAVGLGGHHAIADSASLGIAESGGMAWPSFAHVVAVAERAVARIEHGLHTLMMSDQHGMVPAQLDANDISGNTFHVSEGYSHENHLNHGADAFWAHA